jgi:hypothetical protein
MLVALKKIERARPGIRDFWLPFVGDHQVTEALKILDQEASAALAREDATKALAPPQATKRK